MTKSDIDKIMNEYSDLKNHISSAMHNLNDIIEREIFIESDYISKIPYPMRRTIQYSINDLRRAHTTITDYICVLSRMMETYKYQIKEK